MRGEKSYGICTLSPNTFDVQSGVPVVEVYFLVDKTDVKIFRVGWEIVDVIEVSEIAENNVGVIEEESKVICMRLDMFLLLSRTTDELKWIKMI